MTAMFLYLLCCAAPFEAPLPPPAAKVEAEQPADLTGVYSYLANDGTAEFTGSVVIRKQGERYILQYSLGAETDEGLALFGYEGVGILADGQLSVAWRSGQMVGVTAFRVKGSSLRGGWTTLPGQAQLRQETLRYLGPLPK